jgi:hypothetical protein
MSRVQLAGTAFVMALLAIGFPAFVAAQQYEGGPQEGGPYRAVEPMVTVTGMVQPATDGDGFVLVDQQSGDSIALKGKKKKVAAQEGSNVTLTGRWSKGDPSTKKFRVSEVEAAPAAAAPAAAAPAVAAPASPESPAAESPATEPATPESTESPAPEATQSPAPEAAPAPESPESAAPESSPESPAPQP